MLAAIFFVPLFLFSPLIFATVIADGSTDTTVSIHSSGVEHVAIASANTDGVSHNRYSQFDVPSRGVILNNPATGVNANTIINEVSSSRISFINGPLRVQGVSAHLIIANPNGIVVDGGEFINTGNVTLNTGAVSFNTVPNSGGLGTQDNIVLTTSSGEISIEGAGLSGAMATIDLIAKSIRVDGPITIENKQLGDKVQPLQAIGLFSGETSTEIDVSVSVANALGNERKRVNSLGASAVDEVLVDITPLGSLYAGTIQLVINDKGAGVRHAGSILADGNSFSLLADGSIDNDYQLEIAAGDIQAVATEVSEGEFLGGHIVMQAGSIYAHSNADVQAKVVASNGALEVFAKGDFTNVGGLWQGASRNINRVSSLGGVTLRIGGSITNVTENELQLAAIFSSRDDLQLSAGLDINNHFGRFISNQDLFMQAGNSIHNEIEIADFKGRGLLQSRTETGKRMWQALFLKREITRSIDIDYGESTLPSLLSSIVANGDVVLDAQATFNRGGEIIANGTGSVAITGERLHNEAMLTGKAHYQVSCSNLCDREASSSVVSYGGKISASDVLDIEIAGTLDNIGGQLFSVNAMQIQANEVNAVAIDFYKALQRPRQFMGLFITEDAKLVRADQGGSFISNMGQVNMQVFQKVRLEGGYVEDINGRHSEPSIYKLVRLPAEDSMILRDHIGLFADIL